MIFLGTGCTQETRCSALTHWHICLPTQWHICLPELGGSGDVMPGCTNCSCIYVSAQSLQTLLVVSVAILPIYLGTFAVQCKHWNYTFWCNAYFQHLQRATSTDGTISTFREGVNLSVISLFTDSVTLHHTVQPAPHSDAWVTGFAVSGPNKKSQCSSLGIEPGTFSIQSSRSTPTPLQLAWPKMLGVMRIVIYLLVKCEESRHLMKHIPQIILNKISMTFSSKSKYFDLNQAICS